MRLCVLATLKFVFYVIDLTVVRLANKMGPNVDPGMCQSWNGYAGHLITLIIWAPAIKKRAFFNLISCKILSPSKTERRLQKVVKASTEIALRLLACYKFQGY